MSEHTRHLDPAATAGATVVALLLIALFAGSSGLKHYDVALLPYTCGVVLAAFAVTYRYSVWLQRPPTRLYWRRGWRLVFTGDGPGTRGLRANAAFLMRTAWDGLVAHRFIRRRSSTRWIAHSCFAWGCLLAGAVTFPLVLGWLHFETGADPHTYRVVLLGVGVGQFPTGSIVRYVVFNLLNLSAVMVLTGAVLALRRRLQDSGRLARQQFGNDILPLLLLVAISVTGLALTLSAHLLRGYAYGAISLLHAFVVTATLLYLPFGKLFHVLQRPAQVGVALYRRANAQAAPAVCRTCGSAFAGAMHVADLKTVLREVGFDGTLAGPVPHYADVCPRCRRRLLGFVQGDLLGRTG